MSRKPKEPAFVFVLLIGDTSTRRAETHSLWCPKLDTAVACAETLAGDKPWELFELGRSVAAQRPLPKVLEARVPDHLLTVTEFAKLIRHSPRTVRRWIKAKTLKVVRVTEGGSGRLLIPRVEAARLAQAAPALVLKRRPK